MQILSPVLPLLELRTIELVFDTGPIAMKFAAVPQLSHDRNEVPRLMGCKAEAKKGPPNERRSLAQGRTPVVPLSDPFAPRRRY